MTKKIQLNSTITCPDCGFKKEEIMPTDSCQFFYQCTECGVILKPKKGDCCVFCSYGNVKCPPIQETGTCNCWQVIRILKNGLTLSAGVITYPANNLPVKITEFMHQDVHGNKFLLAYFTIFKVQTI